MKKIISALALLSGACSLQAQELAYKIPQDALAVVTVKGSKFLELLSASEFNNSGIGRSILNELSDRNPDRNITDIEQTGLKLGGTAYYFYKRTDSIGYHGLLIPLSDAAQFERLIGKRDIQRDGDQRRTYSSSDNTLLQWNNEFAMLLTGDLNTSYFIRDTVAAARYGIREISYSDYYNTADVSAPVEEAVAYTVDTLAAVAAAGQDEPEAVQVEEPAMTAADAVETVATEASDDHDTEVEEKYAVADIVPVPSPPVVYKDPATSMMEGFNDASSNYNKAYDEQRKIRKELTSGWVSTFGKTAFGKNTIERSILENEDYLRSLDKNAAATVYVSSLGSLYAGMLPAYFFGLGSPGKMTKPLAGYGSLNAKLYLEKERMRISSEMHVDDRKAAAYKRIYSRKLNKKFTRYINSDKMIGFMSYALDTRAYLEEMPGFIDELYGGYMTRYTDEIGMGAELLSLLLDEKAVAKVIKGDAILLLSDIGPKEYTYTTYEYDDDYNRTEVIKKKTETLPDFLFMMSTDDTRLIERALRYGISKGKISLKNGIYSLDNSITRRNPFSLHFLIQDGILFCGTSYRDIQQIGAGSYQGNISSEQKDLLQKSNMAVFFNPKNIVGKVSEKELGRRLRDFNNLMGNMGQMYIRSTGVKDNRITAEMTAEVPSGNDNSLKYFFSLFELAKRMD